MKVGYRVNNGLFKKYAEEFFFAITKISYILLAVMAFSEFSLYLSAYSSITSFLIRNRNML